ncbi:unnamed protein product [Rotaria socialis]|uniref:Helitron helicase-like domain-containing protein n=1 Tax=Rotaria socialis TaxID=392032 RepID=A0A821LF92_9BILA|nr:unnamed protein product [Rotaria socialis]
MQPHSALNKLLNHIKTIGGRVMGSAYSRTALCTRIHALIYNQGLPSIFLTLNPVDIHSPVALYFAGVKLDLDKIQIEQLMTTYKRAETYFGTVENQGRGSLHLHILIWLDHDMKPSDMKEKIQNANFREKLKAYLEDIIKEDLDEFKDKHVFESFDESRVQATPPRLSRDNVYDTPLPNRHSEKAVHNESISAMNTSQNESKVIPACLPTPNPSSPNFASRFRADIVQLVETSNIHKHSDTCYKYWNANRGDKKSCRMRMPRKLVPSSIIDPDTFFFLLCS